MHLKLINILLLIKRCLRRKRNVVVSIVAKYFHQMKLMTGVKMNRIGLQFALIVGLIQSLENL